MKYLKRDMHYAEYSAMRKVNMCVGLAGPQCRRSPLWAPCPCRTPSTGPSTHCQTTLLPLPNSSYSENVAWSHPPLLRIILISQLPSGQLRILELRDLISLSQLPEAPAMWTHMLNTLLPMPSPPFLRLINCSSVTQGLGAVDVWGQIILCHGLSCAL